VPFDELNLTLNQNTPKKERVRVNVIKESRNRSMKLDARGMRRDEFLKSAEEHILDVINGDIPFVDIIHGHGDGILKSSLKGILKRYSADIDYGHVEGNMGTTRVELKKPI
jgi:DNA mismatch repair protein MutS2